MLCTLYILLVFTIVNKSSASEVSDVSYYLFTKQNQNSYIELTENNLKENIASNAEVVFLIHGWTESRKQDWYEKLKNAFLSKDGPIHIIQVDWSGLAAQLYRLSAFATREVGKIAGEFVIKINEKCGVPLLNFHIIGHSLGGQVAGFIGKTVLSVTRSKIHRITALDPAGLFFAGILVSNRHRLNKYDADVVVVIHTDGGRFGYLLKCGSVDIFPNGGSAPQPGCSDLFRNDTSLFCSHHRSYEFFAEAVDTPRSLIATQCLSYIAYELRFCLEAKTIDVGGDIKPEDAGTYYLTTNPDKPYGKGYKYK